MERGGHNLCSPVEMRVGKNGERIAGDGIGCGETWDGERCHEWSWERLAMKGYD